MSDLSKVVELVFQGVDKTSATTRAIGKSLDDLQRNVGQVTGPLANVADSVLKLDGVLAAASGAVAIYSAKIAGDFDTAFREIATLIDKPLGDLGDFRQQILDYASTSTQSLDQVTSAVYSAISAGVDYSHSLAVVRASEQLAVAGKAELNDALLTLVSSLNAYGAGTDQAQRYADALFTTVKQGQTTLPELAQSLSQVTGIAATSGVSFQELLAAVAALTKTGTPTAEAVTEVRGAIAALLKPSAQAQKTAKALGLEFSAEALHSKGLAGVLKDVKDATGGNTSEMAKLFGRVDALNGVLVLTGKGAGDFAQTLTAMKNSTGAVSEAFDKMSESADRIAQQVVNAFKSVFIVIGQPLVDHFGSAEKAIESISQTLRDSLGDGTLHPIVEGLDSLAESIVNGLGTIAQNLPDALKKVDLGPIIEGAHNLGQALADLFDGIDVSTSQGLADALNRIVKLLGGLENVTAGIIHGLKPYVDLLVTAAAKTSDLDAGTQQMVGHVLGFAKGLNELLPAARGLSGALNGLSGAIGALALSNLAKSAGGVAGIFGGIRSAALGLAAAISGPGGLLTAFGLAVEETTRLTGLGKALNDWLVPDKLAGYQGATIGTIIADIADKMRGASKQTLSYTEAMKQLEEENRRIIDSAEKVRQAAEKEIATGDKGLLTAQDRTDAANQLAAAFERQGYAYNKTTGELTKVTTAEDRAAAAAGKHVQVLRDAKGNIIGYSDGLKGITQHYGEVITKTEQATKKSEDFQAKLEAIQSNERIKKFEAVFQFKAVGLQEETKRIQAAFGSIDNTINSSGQLLGKYTDQLSNYDNLSWDAIRSIQDAMGTETKIRKQAAKDQHDLVQAQIAEYAARADAVRKGDAIIKVSADGLEPEIEAFMWQILKRIQVRATESGSEFLLALP